MEAAPEHPLGPSVGLRAHRPPDSTTPLVDYTIGELLALRASEFPDREALVGVRHGGDGSSVRLTYADLLDEAVKVATRLAEMLEPGEMVALWAPNVVEWTIIQYGAALAGVVLVALNPVLRNDDLDYALRHCGARVLLHADVSRDYAMAEVAEAVCVDIPGIVRISLSEMERWRSDIGGTVSGRVEGGPAAPVMLQYTSGTTGRPKGVLLTHRALVNVAKLTLETARVQLGAVCFNPLPLFHTAGCVIATLGPLWVAGTSILCERFDPANALEMLRHEQVSVFFFVPTVLHALLEHQRGSTDPAPQMQVLMGGASNVSAELIDGAASAFGAQVYNLYGQTELAPVLSMTRPEDSRADQLHTVGRPIAQLECKIIDPVTGDTVGVDEIGEICARGYQQFVEYLHDRPATERALDQDGYVRTGDLGAMDSRGYLTVTGRLKELIIRGGENIAPVEVENVIIEHEDILDAVALGLPDERFGEIVAVACRTATRDRDGLRDSLIDHARSRMPAYKVPARWFLVEEFPITPTGKVQRFALRNAALAQELREL